MAMVRPTIHDFMIVYLVIVADGIVLDHEYSVQSMNSEMVARH